MNIQEIKELIKRVDQAGLQQVELELANIRIKLKRDIEYRQVPVQASAPVAAPAQTMVQAHAAPPARQKDTASEGNTITIKSPMTGTFYASSSSENPPFVALGSTIKAGDPVCIIEAMKLFNEIESEYSGTVEKILVQDGQPVEHDQPLFLLKP